MGYNKQLDGFLSSSFPGLQLKSPLFYNSAIAVRFELGGNLEEQSRVERVIDRALSIFKELNQPTDDIYLTVFVDSWGENPVASFEKDVYELFFAYASGVRNEDIDKLEQEFRYKDPDENGDDDTITLRYCTKAKVKDLKVEELLGAIANREMGYEPRIVGDIFLVNETKKSIFYVYDNRGMDVVAEDKKTLRAVYDKYNNWILDYDRSRIDKIFS
ncbi:DUF3885 domain-containing protein [Paenibacillus sp. FSL L8-0436]|uniref:DUF3885 domain-containing protein n=1 Tax=Paenibacillus borealis TaxID=160799 RepID=A0ABX3GSH1_PAEBO|nr:DUF3885 domain-containing protein [Paenibacillus borealis]OMD34828.1 hypothetical protein BSK56_33440 [Paenibacillus borealis]